MKIELTIKKYLDTKEGVEELSKEIFLIKGTDTFLKKAEKLLRKIGKKLEGKEDK